MCCVFGFRAAFGSGLLLCSTCWAEFNKGVQNHLLFFVCRGLIFPFRSICQSMLHASRYCFRLLWIFSIKIHSLHLRFQRVERRDGPAVEMSITVPLFLKVYACKRNLFHSSFIFQSSVTPVDIWEQAHLYRIN